MAAPEVLNIRGIIESKTWFDRALEAVAPASAHRRLEAKVAKHLFEYQAAQSDRLYAPKTYGLPAESVSTARSRVTMMWEARDLVENYESAKTVLGKFSNFIVPTEWTPGTGDREYDTLVADYFHEKCKAKTCDMTRRHSFHKLLQLAAEMRPVDGDCGLILRSTNKDVRLQLVGAERIGNPNIIKFDDTQWSGVKVSSFGAPLAYTIWNVSNEGIYTSFEEIFAQFFLHYFDPFRADQYRGVSDFHPVIRTMRMQKETLAAENAAQRNKSSHAMIVSNARGVAPTKQVFQANSPVTLPNGQPETQEFVGIGKIAYMSRGDTVTALPSRPGDGFLDYEGYTDVLVARGLGLPYGFLFGTTGYKGPNVRAEFAQAARVIARHQGILADQVANPYKDAVILNGIARGEIPYPPKKNGEDILQSLARATRGEWRYPASMTIDAGRDTTADLNLHRQGLVSGAMIASESGYDYSAMIRQKAAEAREIQDLAVEFGVPETAIALPVNQMPSTPAAAATVGENAGDAAAEAQKDSMPEKAEPAPVKSSATPADSAEKGDFAAKRLEAVRAKLGLS